MKTLHLVLGLLIAGNLAAMGEIPAGWKSDYMRTIAEARTNRNPVLIYFTARWCGPCQRMARTTLVDEQLAAVLKSVEHVALDIDGEPILAEKFAVRAVPTFLVVLPPGTTVDSLVGFQEPEPLTEWLTNTLALAKETLRRQDEIAGQLAKAEASFTSSESLSHSNAVAGLLELLANPPEGIREKITARLNKIPPQDVPWFLPGLNHPALAVRIAAANFLRARLGDSFDIDPWADAATRSREVGKWQSRLPSLDLKE